MGTGAGARCLSPSHSAYYSDLSLDMYGLVCLGVSVYILGPDARCLTKIKRMFNESQSRRDMGDLFEMFRFPNFIREIGKSDPVSGFFCGGQVEVYGKLQESQCVQKQTDYYVVLVGSSLHHVTPAYRTEDHGSLKFTVPGHDVPEKVSLKFYSCVRSSSNFPISPLSHSQELFLEYIQDDAQEVAEQLMTSDPLTSSNHEDILRKYCLENEISSQQNHLDKTGQHEKDGMSDPKELFQSKIPDETKQGLCVCDQGNYSLREGTRTSEVAEHRCKAGQHNAFDKKITQALANLHSLEWDGQTRRVNQDVQNLLHTVGCLGFSHLCHFLLQVSEGQGMVPTVSVEEPSSPRLAEKHRDPTLISALTNISKPVWMCPVWTDGSHQLRFCPVMDWVCLSVKHSTKIDAQSSIQLYRDQCRDTETLTLVRRLRGSSEESTSISDLFDRDQDSPLVPEDRTLVDSVFEEQLVLCLDDEEDDLNTFYKDAASVRLSAMLRSSTKDDDFNLKYSVPGVTEDSSGTDSGVWQMSGVLPLGATDMPPLIKDEEGRKGRSPATRSFSHTSPAGLMLDRLMRTTRAAELSCSSNSPTESCDLSPSLVALEMDSEEDDDDDILMKKPLPQPAPELKNNGDEPIKCNPTADLTCTRSHSASSASNSVPGKDVAQGIRLRSYSYTSPKISLLPPRFSRDPQPPPTDLNQDAALSSSSGSRSLLQALSLSKSLSLLNPVKHRASSTSEQAQEKRELRFRRRAQSADDETSTELADSLQHLTLSEFLKEIEEEEWDKYIIPSKTESEKYKVSRTFSFIKSRMYSTRNKNKGKGKEKETKDKLVNGHQFSAGSVLGSMLCEICGKPASGKDFLHCTYFTVRENSSSTSQVSPSASLPVMTSRASNPLPCPLSRSVPAVTERLSESPDADSDSSPWRNNIQSEDLLQTLESSTSTDSSLIEDSVDSPLQTELMMNAVDLEAESWSLSVEPQFCRMQEKRIIKRQDVIYEFMQTELHHVQTLMIMAEVFRQGMREEVGLDADTVNRIFPCLDELLLLHRDFLSALRERRQSCVQPNSNKNYLIHRVGDIFLQQFSKENAEKMKQVYGDFCSHHTEAVSFFKELQQQNKRFQLFIKQQSSNSLVRRREIPGCILLVTQRITKYPVLLERILQYTEEEEEEEHADLSRALVLIRELISAVDQSVSQFEQNQRLSEVLGRMENKCSAKLKSGNPFRKQDITSGRALLHQGPLLWKTATGRLKDVLALLLSDSLVFLQEKDQKYIFAAVDQKPPVISLQKLIVREVANEERGMFLISASSAGPEMYEVHAASKDERNTWMRHIREAVENCPEEEDETTSESEEERRVAEAKVQKIHRLQESLCGHDQLICANLEEKLHIYAKLSVMVGQREAGPDPRLLVRPSTEDIPQAAVLLNAALKEAENLKAALSFYCASLPSLSDTEEQIQHEPCTSSSSLEVQSPLTDTSHCEEEEFRGEEGLEAQDLNLSTAAQLQVSQSVQSLTQLLYSLQAAVTIQDSSYEVQRLLLLLLSSPSPHPHSRPIPITRSNHALQEQERQREADRRREELADAVRLRSAMVRERQQWERECQVRQVQQRETELALEGRELLCHLEERRLQSERHELQEQLHEYQQSLERLREGQRSVEKEKEKLDTQRRLLDSLKHESQQNLVIPLDGQQSQDAGHLGGEDEHGSIFVNEAAFMSPSSNNRHVHLHHSHHHDQTTHPHSVSLGLSDSPSAQNSLNSLLARSNHRRSSVGVSEESWTGGILNSGPLRSQGTESPNNDLGQLSHGIESWCAGVSGTGLYQDDDLLVNQPFDTMETENRDADGEENIVYL
ncbi:Rho guanine nucleotide exchange factor 28 190 kDa guanine nucleotide exchange factor [Triplophysa tibetana]|uniref:Rho guanine nucleotide exchange factor 28 190 kDa guanine nucleotide exchange factor n=1 Tax=Triplophysa tibetana TaxID=1572043 RepID=A0A5A9P821_9TELE|nr:Rho guanine nucleotide exchange factor 28 190 kDa guanine nucleotide exchange factor [Triplophysa tibetana]